MRALENIRISLDNKKYNEQIVSKTMQPQIIESIIQEYMTNSEEQTNILLLPKNMFVADEIEKLAILKDKNIITYAEFIKQKEKLFRLNANKKEAIYFIASFLLNHIQNDSIPT
ncbi:hypothetical protein ACT7DO_08310 [Bacillus pacificus]